VFVACQFWTSNMFNTKLVGTANAFAAGWGNMGGGAAHFVMVRFRVCVWGVRGWRGGARSKIG